MACAFCGHTMSCVGDLTNGDRLWWCIRCGSLKSYAADKPDAFENNSAPLWTTRKPFVILGHADGGMVVEMGRDVHTLFQTELDKFIDAEIKRRLEKR